MGYLKTISTGNCRISEPSTIIVMWYCCLLLYLGLKGFNLMNLHFQGSTLFLEVIGPQKPYPTDETSTGLWKTTQTARFASDQPSRHEHGNNILDPKSRSKYGNHTTLVTAGWNLRYFCQVFCHFNIMPPTFSLDVLRPNSMVFLKRPIIFIKDS